MAVVNNQQTKTYKAGADLRTHMNKFVKLSADDTVVLATAATDEIIGITCNKANTGELVEVWEPALGGTSKLKLGGTVSRGNNLTTNGSSVGIAATQQTAGQQPTSRVICRALQAGVSGDLIEVGGPAVSY